MAVTADETAQTTDPSPQTQAFQAETRDLLDLMIHSLYTKREIFLRELISNASDAIDKLRYEALSEPELMAGDDRLEIRIEIDPEARTLTISDTGVGMTREEATQNLGTIARSGTKELREKIKAAGGAQSAEDLIGQFGVGFYSAFMVADNVVVVTRRAGQTEATRWESAGDGFFSVGDATRDSRGTSVTLHLRPVDAEVGIDDYTQSWRITDIIRRHSDFIPYPIHFIDRREETERDEMGQPVPGATPKTVTEDRVLNSMKPLWKRQQSEVTPEDYNEFYRHITHDFEEPMKVITARAEGIDEYHALLFIPSRAPFDLYYQAPADVGLRLYAKQVMIDEKSEDLLPRYLRFVRGVVDAGELPLNISRQHLQFDVHLAKIRKWLTKKVLDTLESMRKNDEEQYEKFWAAFGRALKEGVGSDFDNKDRLLPLLRFGSSHDPEKLTTLDGYVERMKEGQTEIFYITGESRAVLERSPHLEALAEEGYEVLFMTDPVDELVLQFVHEYKTHKLKSAAKGALDLKEKPKEDTEAQRERFKPLLEFFEKNLEAEVKRAQISTRLTKSPVCLTVDEHEESPWMERMLQRGKGAGPKHRRILEINPDHPINAALLDKVTANPDDPALVQYANLLVGMALIAEGTELQNPLAFTDAAAGLLGQALTAEPPAKPKGKKKADADAS
jgi:molecular chaperone HtpG